MNRILVKVPLVSVAAWVLASALAAGCTATPRDKPDARTAAAATEQSCAEPTASRIPANRAGCQMTPSRTYSQRDIQRTGQTNAGDALQMLDPSITVHH